MGREGGNRIFNAQKMFNASEFNVPLASVVYERHQKNRPGLEYDPLESDH